MNNGCQEELDAIKRDSAAIVAAIQQAVNEALLDHKRTGDPIVVCDAGGQVRWIPAAEIQIPGLMSQPQL
jgi:hypothetical protein